MKRWTHSRKRMIRSRVFRFVNFDLRETHTIVCPFSLEDSVEGFDYWSGVLYSMTNMIDISRMRFFSNSPNAYLVRVDKW